MHIAFDLLWDRVASYSGLFVSRFGRIAPMSPIFTPESGRCWVSDLRAVLRRERGIGFMQWSSDRVSIINPAAIVFLFQHIDLNKFCIPLIMLNLRNPAGPGGDQLEH